jgi:hypothetical protein
VGGAQQTLHQGFEAFAVTLIRKMPVKRAGQIYLTVFAYLVAERFLFASPGKGLLRLGGFCGRIAAAQRASQGDQACGDRHECRLRQGLERQARERSGGVRQIPHYPECVGGVRSGQEGREPGRRREGGPAGADPVNVAQEPGELDGEENLEVGVDGPKTVCEGAWPTR